MADFRRMKRSNELEEHLEEIKKMGEDDDSEDLYTSRMEEWFSQAFSFMLDLPETVHCWCGHNDIMFALLEPFHSYFESPLPPTSLHKLWNRLSREMRRCTRCVAEHHKAKEYYASEFGEEAAKPLIEVITVLDEKRLADHMIGLVQKFDTNNLKTTEDSVEVICILFEVLMYASLLDDAEINETIKPFLGHVEETHDLSFATNQRYPGVYRLLLHTDQGVRRIAQSLAHKLPLIKTQQDMDAIQPTVDKCMCCLEFDILDPSSSSSSSSPALQFDGRTGHATALPAGARRPGRRRVAFSKDGLWIGLTSIFTLVESPAVVSGLMEKYPTFISTVLSHVSEVTSVFWYALRCLKLLLEMLRYKVWLRTSFSPGAMRNTLLSQCFHSHEERMHVSIFDLFQPFLQSLEALQDGEYENQRRRLLYFLLHQVPRSSNFKPMMTKKARQVAFSIINHGYSMSPPMPPVECVHVWGPPLVAALKDKSLIPSLRKPAADLFECLLVADAAALATVPHQRQLKESFQEFRVVDKDDEDDEEANMQDEMESKDQKWVLMASVARSVESCEQWSCVPLIWVEVLDGIMPKDLPFSVTKGLMWALSRLSSFDCGDFQNNAVRSNGASPNVPATLGSLSKVIESSKDLAAALSWVKPKGYDDGACGGGCLNAVKIRGSDHPRELVKLFKNLGQRYLLFLTQGVDASGSVGQGQEQNWIWDARIAEPCILLLLDGNSTIRDFGKEVLHRTGNASTLEADLELLCSTEASAAAAIRGLRHAVKLLLFLHLKESSRALQQLFFYVWKLFTSDDRNKAGGPRQGLSQTSQNGEGGGFLSQPDFQALTVNESSSGPPMSKPTIQRDTRAWKRFLSRVANLLWPLLVRTVTEGQEHWGSGQLMTWTRMLQLIPFVFRYLTASPRRQAFARCTDNTSSWFNELITWGNVSSAILERWWKEAINGILLTLMDDGLTFSSTPGSSSLLEDLKKPGPIDGSRKLQLMDFLQSVSALAQNKEFLDKDDVIWSPKDDRCLNVVSKEIIDLSDEDPKYSWPSRRTDTTSKPVPQRSSSRGSIPTPKTNSILPAEEPQRRRVNEEVEVIGLSDLSDNVPECLEMAATREKTHSSESILTLEKNPPPKNFEGRSSQIFRPAISPNSSSSSQSNVSPTLDDYLLRFAHEKTQRIQSQRLEVRDLRKFDMLGGPVSRSLPQNKSHKGDGKLSVLRNEHKQSIDFRSSQAGVVRSQVRERLERSVSNKEVRISEYESPSEKILVSDKSEVRGEKPASGVGITQSLKDAADDDATLRALVQEKEEDDPLDSALENVRKSRLASLSEGPAKARRKLIALEMPRDEGTGGRGFGAGRAQGSLVLRKPRQIPRLDDWYKRILSLDYLSLVHLTDESSSTANSAISERLKQVPLTFSSAEQYLSVFRPLVLEEFKSQLRQSHNELNLSDNTIVGALSLMALERVDDLHAGRFMAEAGSDGAARACAENELLLLSRRPLESNQAQSCHLLAKVDSKDRESKTRATVLLLKLFIPTTDARLAKARRLLVDRSKWYMTRLMSITPQLRECQALSSLESMPLMPTVLSPGSAGPGGVGSSSNEKNFWETALFSDIASALKRVPVSLQDRLKRDYNESQLRGIAASIGVSNPKLRDHQLTLIQGPPGTGKTKTIMAILSVLLVAGASKSNVTGAPRLEDESASAFKTSPGTSNRQLSSKGSSSSARDAAAVSRAWQDAARAIDIVKESERLTAVDTSGRKQRVLVCAQSNAAVDEVVARICKNGLFNSAGSFFRPSVVRVGALNSIHPKSLPVYIDTLVDERLGREKVNGSDGEGEDAEQKKVDACRTKLEEVIEFIHAIEALRSRSEDGEGQAAGGQKSMFGEKALTIIKMGESAVTGKLNLLYNQRRALTAEMATAAKDIKKATEESRNIRKAIKRDIIRQADIVVTTLSGCGGDIYSVCMESAAGGDRRRNKKSSPDEECFFDAVVIDEAAQALEPATLIPLQLLAQMSSRCVMVGDPKQLPATVLSQAASRMQYECSLFERLQRAGHPVMMLSVQYRMHPEIREFPSLHFYDGRITDGEGLRGARKALFHREPFFGPYVFFDVVDGQESRKRGSGTAASLSLKNDAEAAAILQLYLAFKRRYPAETRDGRLGIITPYKNQKRLLEEKLVRGLGKAAAADVEVNTVDGFQGREVDILILSTVRAGSGNDSGDRIGFVADVRRMNVALTRARFSMWVVGNAATLGGNSSWSALLSNARRRGVIFRLREPYADIFERDPKQLQILERELLCNGHSQERSGMHANREGRETSQKRSPEDALAKLRGDGDEERDGPLLRERNISMSKFHRDLEKNKKLVARTDDSGGEGHRQGEGHLIRNHQHDEIKQSRHECNRDETSTSRASLWLQEAPNSGPSKRSACAEGRHHEGQVGSDVLKDGRSSSYVETVESRRKGGASDDKCNSSGVAEPKSRVDPRKHDDYSRRRREQLLDEKDERTRSGSEDEDRWRRGSSARTSSRTGIDGERSKGTLEYTQRSTGPAHHENFKLPEKSGPHRPDPTVGSSFTSNRRDERCGSAAATVGLGAKQNAMEPNGPAATRLEGNFHGAARSSSGRCSGIAPEDRMAARKRCRADVAEALPPDAFAVTKKPRSSGSENGGIRHSYQGHTVERDSRTDASSQRPRDTSLGRRSREHVQMAGQSRLHTSLGEGKEALHRNSQQAHRGGRAPASRPSAKDVTSKSGANSELEQILSGLSTVTQAQAKMQKLGASGSKDMKRL